LLPTWLATWRRTARVRLSGDTASPRAAVSAESAATGTRVSRARCGAPDGRRSTYQTLANCAAFDLGTLKLGRASRTNVLSSAAAAV
jgi:hypothetical protein